MVACDRLPAEANPDSTRTTQVGAGISGGTDEATNSPVVTTTPDPSIVSDASSPYAYTEVMDVGPSVLDPAVAYDDASKTVVRNVMETLIYPHPFEPDSYIPLLATGWRVSEDGRSTTFSIRRGIQFSNGNALTPDDVAYSLQRLLLASPTHGPQQLLLTPFLGLESGDLITGVTGIVTGTINSSALMGGDRGSLTDIAAVFDRGAYIGDRAALVENVPPQALEELCETVQAAIVADEGEGTLTIHLTQPWSPLLSALSQTWASVTDRQWAIDRGAWDGSCQTWQKWYALQGNESALATAILGTGPYVLDSWAPGVAYALRANDSYWRDESAMWNDGPSGAPAIETILVRENGDANQRWQLLDSGEALTAPLNRAGRLLAQEQTGEICDWQDSNCQETDNVTGALRRVQNIPLRDRMALFFNFEISAEEDGFTGSGELDGEGIPPDFFADAHVRRAFATCFDRRGFIVAGMGGDGFLFRGLLPAFIANPTLQEDPLPYRLQLCSQELALAWDGILPTTGFRMEIPFEAGDAGQQAVALLLQTNLRAVNPDYHVDVVGLPAPLLQQELRDRRAPLALVSWQPALPDPYYWVAPAFSRAMLAYQHPPVQMQIEALAHLDRLRAAVTPTLRSQALGYLQQFYVEELPFIQLPQTSTTTYQQRRLETWLYHGTDLLPYYYAYAVE